VTLDDPCAEIRRPGRPRSTEADRAILDAAVDEYGEQGLAGLTVDAVAARAGVSKATIYRRYPCKADLVIAAVHTSADDTQPKVVTGDIRRDLRSVLEHLRAVMQHPRVGRSMRMLIVDSHRDEQLRCLHRDFVRVRRAGTIAMLTGAAARGDLRADIDTEVAAEQLVGPIFYRFLVSGDVLDDAYLDALVETFLGTYANRTGIS
jgi:AcrR family transcriptional regulator